MRSSEVDAILTTILEFDKNVSDVNISDVNISVDRPFQVEASGQLLPVTDRSANREIDTVSDRGVRTGSPEIQSAPL